MPHLGTCTKGAAAPLPVLGPWPALRSGSAWPRITRVLSQVRTGCRTAEKYSNRPARRLTRAHVGNRCELGAERAALGVPVVRDQVVTLALPDDGYVIRREQYERLERHLLADGRGRIEMTFAEVSAVIGAALPPSAFNRSAWWGTDPKHTQATWLDAGYQAHPNLTAQRVVFTRTGDG